MAKKKKTQSKKPKLGILLFGLIFAAAGVYLVVRSFAATVALNATSNKTSVEKDQTFIVTVGTNSGTEPISIGHVRLTFDPSLVQYISTDYANTSFTDNTPENTTGAGYVQLSRFTTQRPAGNLIIGRVTFKALASSGNLEIGIDSDNSNIYSAADASDILGASNGVTIAVKEPEPVDPGPVVTDPGTPEVPGNEQPGNPEEPTEPTNPDGGTGGGVVVTPTNPPKTPPTVPKGGNVTAVPKTKTTSGSAVKKTDFYVNDNYVGTSQNQNDPVNIDTDNLAEGTYEITAEAQGQDGSVDEDTQSFTVTKPSFFTQFRLPLVVSGLAVVAVGIGFIAKFVLVRSVPFYKTI